MISAKMSCVLKYQTHNHESDRPLSDCVAGCPRLDISHALWARPQICNVNITFVGIYMCSYGCGQSALTSVESMTTNTSSGFEAFCGGPLWVRCF